LNQDRLINLQQTDNGRQRFIRRTGFIYGAIFAIAFGLALWGPDANALRAASVYLWWGKLAVGLVLILPLGMLTGWLAASVRWTGLAILLWVAAGLLITVIAGHVGYEGLSWLTMLSDPYPSSNSMFAFTSSSAAVTGIATIMGMGLGLLISLLSLWATNRAWEHSNRSNQLSLRSIFALIVGVFPILIIAPMQDFQINATLRSGFEQTAKAIKATADPKVDLLAARLPFMESVRPLITPNFTMYWVSASSDQQILTTDILFDNGVLLRCNANTYVVGPCVQINKDFPEWMTELMTAGHLTCTYCGVQTDRATRRWLALSLPSLQGVKLQSIQMLQYQSGRIYERATFENGDQIDCRFSGASPVVVDLCVDAKN
jgi:hypothetical protein